MRSILENVDPAVPLNEQKKPDWVCEPGDLRVRKYGWTKLRFRGYLSILPEENTIYVSAITSIKKGRGNFSKLVRNIHKAGFTIKVTNPFPQMEAICKHLGFVNKPEFWPEMDEMVDCYVLEGRS